MSEGQEAVAALAESLIVDFAKDGNESALAIIEQAQTENPPPAAPEAAPAPAPEAAAAPAEPAQEAAPAPTFELNPELPEDLAAELAEAEIEDEVEREVAAYEPETDEWGNPVEVDQDAVREAVKLRKRNEYLEKQLVQTKRGQWEAEAEKFFPLAKHALPDIQATSRRSFLKAAKAEHDRILPHVQAYLGEAKQVVDAEKQSATTEARAAVAESWGKPLTGPDNAMDAAAVAREQEIEKARSRVREGKGALKDVFAAMMRNG